MTQPAAIAADAVRIDVRRPDDVAAAWQSLWQRTAGASPFVSPAWLLAWAKHYADDRCRVATASVGDALVGCLPMFWWERRLLLAGTGPSDHGDALFAPGWRHLAGALLAALVETIDRPVDCIDLQQLPATSPLLACTAPAGWHDRVEPGDLCPVLTLAGERGMASVGKRMRRNWRYALHAIERAGGRVARASAGEAGAAIADLERLHALRWQDRGEPGVLVDPLFQRLLADAAPALADAGMLRVQRVEVGSTTVAVLLAMHGERRTCCYLSGFDPAWARLSPVTALIGATIAVAAEEGDAAVDFLRGEEPYKFGWGAAAEPRYRRVWTRSGIAPSSRTQVHA